MIVSRIEEDNPRLFDRKKLHKQRQPTDIPPTKRKRREHHPLPAQFTRENFLFCPSLLVSTEIRPKGKGCQPKVEL
ncbi:hypothetical protein SJDPG11_01690 [Porphyromonas gingivalis SJD11]|nr:hypothetical protein SJDPG11_01690 [Porphyromonas gingivalis SJD11]